MNEIPDHHLYRQAPIPNLYEYPEEKQIAYHREVMSTLELGPKPPGSQNRITISLSPDFTRAPGIREEQEQPWPPPPSVSRPPSTMSDAGAFAGLLGDLDAPPAPTRTVTAERTTAIPMEMNQPPVAPRVNMDLAITTTAGPTDDRPIASPATAIATLRLDTDDKVVTPTSTARSTPRPLNPTATEFRPTSTEQAPNIDLEHPTLPVASAPTVNPGFGIPIPPQQQPAIDMADPLGLNEIVSSFSPQPLFSPIPTGVTFHPPVPVQTQPIPQTTIDHHYSNRIPFLGPQQYPQLAPIARPTPQLPIMPPLQFEDRPIVPAPDELPMEIQATQRPVQPAPSPATSEKRKEKSIPKIRSPSAKTSKPNPTAPTTLPIAAPQVAPISVPVVARNETAQTIPTTAAANDPLADVPISTTAPTGPVAARSYSLALQTLLIPAADEHTPGTPPVNDTITSLLNDDVRLIATDEAALKGSEIPPPPPLTKECPCPGQKQPSQPPAPIVLPLPDEPLQSDQPTDDHQSDSAPSLADIDIEGMQPHPITPTTALRERMSLLDPTHVDQMYDQIKQLGIFANITRHEVPVAAHTTQLWPYRQDRVFTTMQVAAQQAAQNFKVQEPKVSKRVHEAQILRENMVNEDITREEELFLQIPGAELHTIQSAYHAEMNRRMPACRYCGAVVWASSHYNYYMPRCDCRRSQQEGHLTFIYGSPDSRIRLDNIIDALKGRIYLPYRILQTYVTNRVSSEMLQTIYNSNCVQIYVIHIDKHCVNSKRKPNDRQILDAFEEYVAGKGAAAMIEKDLAGRLNLNFGAATRLMIHSPKAKNILQVNYMVPEDTEATIFTKRVTTKYAPPRPLIEVARDEQAHEMWRARLMTDKGVWNGPVSTQEHQRLHKIHEIIKDEPKYRNLIKDRAGRDFTEAFAMGETAAASFKVARHLRHLFFSRPQTGTVYLVYDFEVDYDDYITHLAPNAMLIDLAHCLITKLYNWYPDRFKTAGVKAMFTDVEMGSAFRSESQARDIPDFDEMYADIMSAPQREISRDDLLGHLHREPPCKRTARIFDLFKFYVQYMARHILQVSQFIEFDANPITFMEFHSKFVINRNKKTMIQPFYRKLHEKVSNFADRDAGFEDPVKTGVAEFFDAKIKKDNDRQNGFRD